MIISGNVSFIKNKTYSGGALSMFWGGRFNLLIVNKVGLSSAISIHDSMKFFWKAAVSEILAKTCTVAEYVGASNFNVSSMGMVVFLWKYSS